MNLSSIVPKDKLDTGSVALIEALGFPAVEPVMPQILEWMQDINWPVAQALQPFLAGIGAPLTPYIRAILATEDETWKYWALACIVSFSDALSETLRTDLKRLARSPTVGEALEEVNLIASDILERRPARPRPGAA